jgi:tetratricopeptide (TPR) repeat protein
MNPNDYHSLTLRGYLLFKSNQLDDALIDLNLAISIEPSFAVAYNNRALVYKSLYNYPQALNDLNKAISIDSQFFNAIYNRAKLFLDMNQPEKACKDLVVAYKGGIADAGLLIEEFCR